MVTLNRCKKLTDFIRISVFCFYGKLYFMMYIHAYKNVRNSKLQMDDINSKLYARTLELNSSEKNVGYMNDFSNCTLQWHMKSQGLVYEKQVHVIICRNLY